jgi:uroporphyrinogen decarboxylase
MTPKERILAILSRQPVDRLPVDLWHTPEISAALRRHFGVQDDFAMWKALGLDKIVWDFMDYRIAAWTCSTRFNMPARGWTWRN